MILAKADWDGLQLEFDGGWSCKQSPIVADTLNVLLQGDPPGPDEPDKVAYAFDKAKERAATLKLIWRLPLSTKSLEEEIIY